MIALYSTTLAEAHDRSTWRLRRLERRARRQATAIGTERLGAVGLTRWAAIRQELRSRGVRLPEAGEAPRWWQR